MKQRILRAIAILAGALVISAALIPAIVKADAWYGEFMRDSLYNLDVNCKLGCSAYNGSTLAAPGYSRVEDASTTTLAGVISPGDDNQPTTNGLQTVDMLMGFNPNGYGSNQFWTRVQDVRTDQDAIPVAASIAGQSESPYLGVGAFLYGYNGTTFDRLRDAVAPAPIGVRATGYGSTGASAPVVCDQSVAINATATAQLVALSGTTAIYVCGFSMTLTGTSPTAQLEYGTGTACATGPVALTGAYAPAAGADLQDGGAQGAIMRTIAGQELCIVLGGTTPSAQGILTYAQF